MIILRPKNVNFERFWPPSKFHFPACSTLLVMFIRTHNDIKLKIGLSLGFRFPIFIRLQIVFPGNCFIKFDPHVIWVKSDAILSICKILL